VLLALQGHGLEARPDDDPQATWQRLYDLYRAEVGRLRERQRRGEVPLRDYAGEVARLRDSFPLLAVPPEAWPQETP
jgi:hypothetical protein